MGDTVRGSENENGNLQFLNILPCFGSFSFIEQWHLPERKTWFVAMVCGHLLIGH